MKLMVIGGGGREHAIIKKLKENPAVEKIYCLPRRTALIMPLSRRTTPSPSARWTR